MTPIDKIFIEDLENGQTVMTTFVAKKKQLRDLRDKSGKYLMFQLADKTGEIEARVWEEAEKTNTLFCHPAIQNWGVIHKHPSNTKAIFSRETRDQTQLENSRSLHMASSFAHI